MDKKIVMFPHLKQRLIGDGLVLFKESKYHEAIELLEEALLLGMDSSLFSMALLVSYNETNQLDKGKRLVLQLLKEKNGDFLKMLDLAVMIFHQTNEHELIIEIIDKALENPDDEILTDSIKRELEAIKKLSEDMITKENFSRAPHLDLFGCQTLEEQLDVTQELMNQSVAPHIDEITRYLAAPGGQNFFKTLLVFMLEDKNDNQEFIIKKMKREMKIVPKELKEKNSQLTKEQVINEFIQKYEHTNPTLLKQIVDYVNRIYFIIYPFDFEQFKVDTIVNGFEKKLETLFDLKESIKPKDKYHNVVDSEIQRFYLLLNKLE